MSCLWEDIFNNGISMLKDSYSFWNFQNPLSLLACCIWNMEWLPLGNLAPYILGIALWKNGNKVDKGK